MRYLFNRLCGRDLEALHVVALGGSLVGESDNGNKDATANNVLDNRTESRRRLGRRCVVNPLSDHTMKGRKKKGMSGG